MVHQTGWGVIVFEKTTSHRFYAYDLAETISRVPIGVVWTTKLFSARREANPEWTTQIRYGATK